MQCKVKQRRSFVLQRQRNALQRKAVQRKAVLGFVMHRQSYVLPSNVLALYSMVKHGKTVKAAGEGGMVVTEIERQVRG